MYILYAIELSVRFVILKNLSKMLAGKTIGIIGIVNAITPNNLKDFLLAKSAKTTTATIVAIQAALDQVNIIVATNNNNNIEVKNFSFFCVDIILVAIINGNIITRNMARIFGFSKRETTRVFINEEKL